MFWHKRKKGNKRVHISKKELERLYYDERWTQAQIAKHYGCGQSTISRFMREYGLKARHIGDYIRIEIPCTELRTLYTEQKWGVAKIANRYDCDPRTISRRLRDCDITARPFCTPPQEHVPPKAYARWTPTLAYAVGLITADGSLSRSGNEVSLCLTDRELITHYRACLQLAPSVPIYKRQEPGYKPLYRVRFADLGWRGFLERVGLTPAKSKTLRSLDIPHTVFADFTRGLWDGDGCWAIQRKRGRKNLLAQLASSSPAFLKWIQERIERQTGLHGGISGNLLYYFGSKAVALGHWLYYAPGLPALTRKRSIWERFT
jgi:transposase-like protein